MNRLQQLETRIAELEAEVAILKLAVIVKPDARTGWCHGSTTGNEPAKPANGDFIGVPFSAQPPDAHAVWKSAVAAWECQPKYTKLVNLTPAGEYNERQKLNSLKP